MALADGSVLLPRAPPLYTHTRTVLQDRVYASLEKRRVL